jgi:hypothetical protein
LRSFLWFIGLIAAGFVAMAVFTYPAWLAVSPVLDAPFHRVGSRLGMLFLLVGFILMARRLGLADRASLGYALPRPLFHRGDLPARRDAHRHPAPVGGAARRAADGAGLLWTHFIGKYRIPADQVGPGSGLELLAGSLGPFGDPLKIADAFLCLLAVGVLLGMVRTLTGNIAACIGLHAGWVWVITFVRETSVRDPSNEPACPGCCHASMAWSAGWCSRGPW